MRGSAYRVVVDANSPAHAYIAALEGGLHIFDHYRTDNPAPHWKLRDTRKCNGRCVSPDERAYLLDSAVGVAVLDVTEPNDPRLKDVYENDALPIDVKVGGNYLYLLDSDSIQVIDTRTLTVYLSFS